MSRTILIADDDHDVVSLLSRRCQTLGLTAIGTSSATSALAAAVDHVADLVILDVDMPHGNGLSVCEMMAGHAALQSVPVIVITGDTQPETIRRCHSLQAYYVLKSPDLWARVEPLLLELLTLPPKCERYADERSARERPYRGICPGRNDTGRYRVRHSGRGTG